LLTLAFIIAFVFCIAIAIAAILIGHHLINSFSNGFLKSLFYYIIAFYAFAFYGIWAQLVVQYVLIDLNIEQQQLLAIVNFLPALGIPFLIVSWIMLLKVACAIVESTTTKKEIVLHLIAVAAIVVITGGSYYFIFISVWWENNQLLFIEYALLLAAELVYLLLFIGVILKSKDKINSKIYQFALLCLGAYLIRVLVLVFAIYYPHLLAPAILLWFLSGIMPILYLRFNADTTLDPIQASSTDKRDLEAIFEKFQISKRERQIVDLICQGKSNQQIADELFISLQTVKDHTHRIYTKVGINSRMQLVAVINA
jgi:DNA-binding CsgD family transcriptional regulator